jgi:hypothetical protein
LARRTETEPAVVRKSGLKYAFVGLSARAGATTLAFAFADRLARAGASGRNPRSVTVVEISGDGPRRAGCDFDRVGIDRRFAGREYVSCYDRLAHGGSARQIANIDGGVNWMLRVPGERFGDFDAADYVRLSAGAPGDVVILDVCGDFGYSDKAALTKLLHDCDRVFAVVDPLPSALLAGAGRLEMFKSLESTGTEIVYVANKMNRGVDMKELRAFLKVRRLIEAPFLDPAGIYAAEYNCCTAYAMPKLAPALEQAFALMEG